MMKEKFDNRQQRSKHWPVSQVAKGKISFSFGLNWQKYLRGFSEEKLRFAMESL